MGSSSSFARCSCRSYIVSSEVETIARKIGLESLVPSHASDSDDGDDTLSQNHVFTFADELTKDELAEITSHMAALDLDNLADMFDKSIEVHTVIRNTSNHFRPEEMDWQRKRPPKPKPGFNITVASELSPHTLKSWRNHGFQQLSFGKVAVVMMICGGGARQHLRAGVDGDHSIREDECLDPMVIVDVGLPSHKSMLQIFFERIRRLLHLCSRCALEHAMLAKERGLPQLCAENAIVKREYIKLAHNKWAEEQAESEDKSAFKLDVGMEIPVYIMLSEENRNQVENFVERNGYFNLSPSTVHFFTSDQMPLLDEHGRLLLRTKSKVWMNPEGTGSIFRGLLKSGCLADMKSRDIQAAFLMDGDNMLTHVADPTFIGLCSKFHMDAGIKGIERQTPDEVFPSALNRLKEVVEDDDHDGDLDVKTSILPTVIPHAEVHVDALRLRDEQHRYLFGNCALGQYYFSMGVISRFARSGPFTPHRSRMRVPHVSPRSGEVVEPGPGENNAIALETCVADAFEFFRVVPMLKVEREAHYAVVRTDADIASAIFRFCLLHQEWIIAGGGALGNACAGFEKAQRCEVSPLVSYDGEDLEGAFGHIPERFPFHLMACGEVTTRDATALPETSSYRESHAPVTYAPRMASIDGPPELGFDEVVRFRQDAFLSVDGVVPDDCCTSERLCRTPKDLLDERKYWAQENKRRERLYKEEIERKHLRAPSQEDGFSRNAHSRRPTREGSFFSIPRSARSRSSKSSEAMAEATPSAKNLRKTQQGTACEPPPGSAHKSQASSPRRRRASRQMTGSHSEENGFSPLRRHSRRVSRRMSSVPVV